MAVDKAFILGRLRVTTATPSGRRSTVTNSCSDPAGPSDSTVIRAPHRDPRLPRCLDGPVPSPSSAGVSGVFPGTFPGPLLAHVGQEFLGRRVGIEAVPDHG